MGYGGETSDVIRDEKEEKNTNLKEKLLLIQKQSFITNSL
jgi:hypothetical protein